VTPHGSAVSGRAPLVLLVAGAAVIALLSFALAGCDESPLTIPGTPARVQWTRITDTTSVRDPYYPEWRGDRIAFERLDSALVSTVFVKFFRLCVAGEDGTNPTFLPGEGFSYDSFPRWVDDSTLVMSSTRSGNYDTWYLTIPTGAARRLTDFVGSEFFPVPRPGRPAIAFVTGTAPRMGRIALIPDTAAVPLAPIFLTADTLQAGEPDWDPAGERVCFSALGPGGSRHIWAFSMTDTVPHQLTTGGIHDVTPRWSPDGTKILFSSDRNGRSGVWYVDPAGEASGLELISFEDRGAEIYSPSWSPDGTRIVLSSNGRYRGQRAIWVLSNLGF